MKHISRAMNKTLNKEEKDAFSESMRRSEYLEETDGEYRDKLLAITEKGQWNEWVLFFLKGVKIQAKRNNQKAKLDWALYEELKTSFREVTKSQYSQAALDAFFTKPVINSTDFIKISNIENRGTANGILKQLLDANLITLLKAGSGRAPSTYVLPRLFNIVEGKKVFGV